MSYNSVLLYWIFFSCHESWLAVVRIPILTRESQRHKIEKSFTKPKLRLDIARIKLGFGTQQREQ